VEHTTAARMVNAGIDPVISSDATSVRLTVWRQHSSLADRHAAPVIEAIVQGLDPLQRQVWINCNQVRGPVGRSPVRAGDRVDGAIAGDCHRDVYGYAHRPTTNRGRYRCRAWRPRELSR